MNFLRSSRTASLQGVFGRDCVISRAWSRRLFSDSGPQAVALECLEFPAKEVAHGPDGTPVVFIHGLLGSSINFRTICRKQEISGHRNAFSVDMRNHGSSPHSKDTSWRAMAADIAKFLDDRNIPQAHVVGHSMGGRVAMATALLHPEKVSRLVVVDVAPVDYQAVARQGKQDASVATESSLGVLQAMKSLDLDRISREGGQRAQLDEELAQQPGMESSFLRGFVLQNCVQDGGTGSPWKWRVGLDELLDSYHSDLTTWSFADDEKIEHETLFVGGTQSPFMRGHEESIHRLCPGAHIHNIDCGHYVHSERPAEFLQAVGPFLNGGWTQHTDPKSGKLFYFQASTGKSQWEI